MPRPVETRACAFPDSRFAELSGRVELDIGQAYAAPSRPERVSALLVNAYAEIDGQPPDRTGVNRLSAGTREWLLQRAILELAPPGDWFEITCPACASRFDLQLQLDQAPCQLPGPGFPEITVSTALGEHRFETPNGAHEIRLARLPAAHDLRRSLVELCSLEDDRTRHAAQYERADLDRIDAALEAGSPDVADRTRASCPDCGTETEVLIDPLEMPMGREITVLHDVDRLACAYGWSEADILNLPTRRRRHYVRLVEARLPRRRP